MENQMYRVNVAGSIGYGYKQKNGFWLVKTVNGVSEYFEDQLTIFNKVQTTKFS